MGKLLKMVEKWQGLMGFTALIVSGVLFFETSSHAEEEHDDLKAADQMIVSETNAKIQSTLVTIQMMLENNKTIAEEVRELRKKERN
jgi:hypothetical protein